MKRIAVLLVPAVAAALGAVSCRQMFTTSLGEAFARDSISVSSSTPLSDLIDIAATEGGDSAAAEGILDALGSKDTADIQALSVEDQTEILNLAATASLDLPAVTDLLAQAQNDGSSDDLVADILDAFNTGVNLDAVVAVLEDPEALAEAPVDSLIMASAVVVADVAADLGTDAIMDILADNADSIDGGTGSIDLVAADGTLTAAGTAYGLTADQAAELESVLGVVSVLTGPDAREDAGDATIGGFDLTDLLSGTQG